ncbi:MAG TPA: glutamyl-tRNA reductase [Dehalococcoidia bacterium]|jgi:glutamyl-tRNA reductase|nr:glutamyl-tRNA reductase [Dehalococcoidia bacterium]
MNIYLVGINHRTAPVAVREKVAIRIEALGEALELLRAYVPHGVILSTCNRTEVYTLTSEDGGAGAASLNFLQTHLDIPDKTLRRYIYTLEGQAAVEHLFRIACGLDSMIIGEYEVLGQVSQALEAAEKAKMVSLPIRHLFQEAIRTGRRVREETAISKNALSVSSVAVELAAKTIGHLQNCKMLVIGAGEAGRLAAKAAKDRGVSQITVVSRTRARASTLAAQLGGRPITINEMAQELNTCDLVVACAGAPHHLLGVQHIEEVMRHRPKRPMVIIDIAVPRIVAPEVAEIKNVFLYNIDDLTQISEQNRRRRQGEMEKAAKIIAAEMAEFAAWWQTLETRPVISALMKKAEAIRSTQLSKTLKKLRPLSDEERESLEAMTKSIVTKILQEPISYLKENAGSHQELAEIVSKLFSLDGKR